MLENVKMLLGIKDDSKDTLLSFLIDDCISLILAYCRIEFLPQQLKSLVPMIVADMYRAKGYGAEEAPQTIKSVTEGSRSETYDTNTPNEDILASYSKRLEPYRNIKGRVPSDVSI